MMLKYLTSLSGCCCHPRPLQWAPVAAHAAHLARPLGLSLPLLHVGPGLGWTVARWRPLPALTAEPPVSSHAVPAVCFVLPTTVPAVCLSVPALLCFVFPFLSLLCLVFPFSRSLSSLLSSRTSCSMAMRASATSLKGFSGPSSLLALPLGGGIVAGQTTIFVYVARLDCSSSSQLLA